MGLKITGISNLLHKLSRTEERTTERSRRRVEKGAKQIEARAKLYAPVDTHDLENAIKMTDPRTGIHGRREWLVGVDKDSLDLGSRRGFDYATQMHEKYPATAPNLKSSKKSFEKNEAALGSIVGPYTPYNGNIVGGKYLERAFNDYVQEIQDDVTRVLKEETQ